MLKYTRCYKFRKGAAGCGKVLKMAKKILYIFIFTVLAGVLIFSTVMMIKYFNEAAEEEKEMENNPMLNPVTGTPTPTEIPATPTPSPSPTPVPEKNYDEEFYMSEITDEIFERIKGKSYPEGATVSLDDLRWCHVVHYGFDGEIHEGEIIVNKAIAEDTLEIFKELFDIKYEIEKIRLIDEYDADDERSMEDNNSSSFCYRTIAETTVLSNHALGLAIDINTLYNPYVYTRKDGTLFLQPENAADYVDREKENPHFIKNGDECYNIFIAHGFTWGGDWNTKKDYQHFEKSID